MKSAIHPTLHAAATLLVDRLSEHIGDDPDTWRGLWQPPIPDQLVASPPHDLPDDPSAGELLVAAGHAHWSAAPSQPPAVWVTLTEKRDGTTGTLVESFDFRGRITRVPFRVPAPLADWAATIPRPGS